MRKPIPWGVRGSGGDVREAARDAARREGMTLSEWLAQAVGQYAARVGTDPANMNEDDRVEAIAAQLHRLGIRGARRGELQAPRAKPRLPRADNWPARSSKPHANNPGAAYAAEDALLERALARLEDRADFETLAHRIDHLEAELAEAAPQNTMQPIRGALARLEARLDFSPGPLSNRRRTLERGRALCRRTMTISSIASNRR